MCVLLNNDVQTCDFVVTHVGNKFMAKANGHWAWGQEVAQALVDVGRAFAKCENVNKRGKQASCTGKGNTFTLSAECLIDKKAWKFCFHTTHKDEDPS